MRKKKLITLVLTLFCAISIAACGKAGESGSGKETGKDSGSPTKEASGKSGNDSEKDKEAEKTNTAEKILGKREGWTFSRCGGDAYKIWDKEALPDCFPDPVEGVDLADYGTSFKGIDDDDTLNSNKVGNISYEDSRFEEYSVGFYCNQEHVDKLLAEIEKEGFQGGLTGESSKQYTYEYLGNGYYLYVWVNAAAMGQDDYTHLVDVVMTPTLLALPKKFGNISLPQFGLRTDMEDFVYASAYDSEYTDMSDEANWDIDKNEGNLKNYEYYSLDLRYTVVTRDQVKSYKDQLISAGLTLGYEYDEEDYHFSAKASDGVYISCTFTDYDKSLSVQIVNDENLFY